MAKKAALFADAERFYVVEQMTLAEIADRLKICERTVRTWKDEGKWEERRKQLLASKESFHAELYEFARKLMRSIKDDIDAGEKIDAGRLYTFSRLLPAITKVKEYEDQVVASDPKAAEKVMSEEDVVKAVQKALLGE
jgi:hypothetical protein